MSDVSESERREVHARFDRLFAKCHLEDSPRTRSLLSQISAANRGEARAAAQRLWVIGELFTVRLAEFGESAEWAVDTMDEVGAEVAAELGISQGLAMSHLRHARAMRERLPRVAERFRAGDIDVRMFAMLVFRTDLIANDLVLAFVDAELSVLAPGWNAWSKGRAGGEIDRIVARADRDAVRRRRDAAAERGVWFGEQSTGLSEVRGALFTSGARALDRRLTAVAGTVCGQDGRTLDQRRADALVALAAGADRLACGCGTERCPAAGKAAPAAVLIHVIAEQATLAGRGESPGSEVGSDAVIGPELLAELAKNATLRPLVHPGDAAPEPGYVPSRALADFVRCRDLTCRAPGCDRPAVGCDIDHTIAYPGGPTHASNLKCLCRFHHLLKTFWGWRDEQLRDGTVIWSTPGGEKYVTTAGSALLFPSLCQPTGPLPPAPEQRAENPSDDRCGDRSVKMPRRRATRAREHARRVAAERRENRQARCDDARTRYESQLQDRSPPPF